MAVQPNQVPFVAAQRAGERLPASVTSAPAPEVHPLTLLVGRDEATGDPVAADSRSRARDEPVPSARGFRAREEGFRLCEYLIRQ
jgi:hypothetical protein